MYLPYLWNLSEIMYISCLTFKFALILSSLIPRLTSFFHYLFLSTCKFMFVVFAYFHPEFFIYSVCLIVSQILLTQIYWSTLEKETSLIIIIIVSLMVLYKHNLSPGIWVIKRNEWVFKISKKLNKKKKCSKGIWWQGLCFTPHSQLNSQIWLVIISLNI